MTDQQAFPTSDGLDELITQLLDCGAALSQVISHMQAFEAPGLSSPNAPPILEVADSLIRDACAEIPKHHTYAELRGSAEIINQVTAAICENIFFVPPSEIRPPGASGSPGSRRRQQGRSRRRKR
ncbi:MAG TPA: hypothetical protein VMJ65_06515 [Solirubrobacteraceae bacterium]|nr:hypothetical protein [Solirubrobacteraceae bacterium]